MHSARHPRNVAILGVIFIIIGALYALTAVPLGFHIEWAGVTMLGALGVAMAIMAYVLVAGSTED